VSRESVDWSDDTWWTQSPQAEQFSSDIVDIAFQQSSYDAFSVVVELYPAYSSGRSAQDFSYVAIVDVFSVQVQCGDFSVW